MNVGSRIPRVAAGGRSRDGDRLKTCLRTLSTKVEKLYIEDVLKRSGKNTKPVLTEKNISQNGQIPAASTAGATVASATGAYRLHKNGGLPLDFSNRDPLSLKCNMKLLDSCQTGLVAMSNISSRWRQLDGAKDHQKILENKLSELSGKQDTMLYSTTHDHLWRLAQRPLHALGVQVLSVDRSRVNETSAPDKSRDNNGVIESTTECTRILQTRGVSSAKPTLEHISSIQDVENSSKCVHLFRDDHDLCLLAHLLQEGCRMFTELNSPSLVQSSLGLISPGYEVRYMSGPRSVIKWMRRLQERHRVNTNIPQHVAQPILQTLMEPEHARRQLYQSLNNAVILRHHLVELPCNIRGDALTTMLEIDDNEASSVVQRYLTDHGVHVSVSPGRDDYFTDISLTSHANHTDMDRKRIRDILTLAFKSHVLFQRCM